jgi:hypothetical protein
MPPRKQPTDPAAIGCHNEPSDFPKINPAPQKNRFSRQGNTDVVQKYDGEDEHKSVTRDVR